MNTRSVHHRKAAVKTSTTHPLQIDEVHVPGTPGIIGMTLLPGRKGPSAEGGSWDRDLNADLNVVKTWEPTIAIALLEDKEYDMLGVPGFKAAVRDAELPWIFLSIQDGGVPDSAFADQWAVVGPRVRNDLRRGGRVLIHCRAGLGRTGMLAAALFVELGVDSDTAIKAIRKARRDTIETLPQEAYVRSCKSCGAMIPRAARIAGLMFGAAIGDALGSAFEFLSAATIERALGEPFAWNYLTPLPGSLLRDREAGLPTDDTAMALSVAGVIASDANRDAEAFARAFLRDLDLQSGRFGTLFWLGGPGGTTIGALRRLASGAAPESCGLPDAGANGAAMRVHPVGVIRSRSDVLRISELQAKVSHGHPSAVEAAKAVAVTVHDALAACEPEVSPPAGIEDETFIAAWLAAHEGLVVGAARLPEHLLDADMSGWVTVATAHAIAYVYQDDPNRAIAAAAASGGDTDTVASIVGAIVGARCGIEALNPTWLEGLRVADDIRDAIAHLENV